MLGVSIGGVASSVQPRILVLDDKQIWLDTIELLLDQEFELVLTTSPEKACRKVQKELFDLVVLDEQLSGGISGLDVLSRMRKANPHLRAIILTGVPDIQSALESGKRGALAYVSKGSAADLKGTVAKVLGRDERPVRIFLSYEISDRPEVVQLYEGLLERGFLPWMDIKSIVGGKKWEPKIHEAIRNTDYFILCLSAQSLLKSKKRSGVMRKEIEQALSRQEGLPDETVFFIPVRLEECEIPPPFDRFQWINSYEVDGFERLLRALEPK